ncbi:MAG: hypothetical protein K0B37_09040 [Bacteroidales bacterium]|nr:hypothetical protein [Bacteroidales bacterium]
MKQLSLLLVFVVLTFCNALARNETENKFNHQIGVQFNPFLNDLFFEELSGGDFSRTLWVFSSRYGYKASFNYNLLLGGEVTYIQTSSRNPTGFSKFNMGPWGRFIFLEHTWVKLFTESSVFLSYYDTKLFSFTDQPIKDSGFDWGYYLSPGFSLNAAESRWSFDFSWKFSTIPLIDGRKDVFSFKINFQF